jgi:PAS domain S-box-containing protein
MKDPLPDTLFRAVCETSGVGLLITDEKLNIRFANDAAAGLLGEAAEDLVGEPIARVIPQRRHDLAIRYLERTLARGEPSDFETMLKPVRNRSAQMAVSVSPLTDESQQVVGLAIHLRDITRHADVIRTVAESQKMTALGSMAGAVAHHFNNVLGGIITSIDFAQTSDNPEVLRRALKTTIGALSRANDLTLDLLTFAEGDHSDSSLTDLASAVQRHATRVTERLECSEIKVETDIEPVGLLFPAKPLTTLLAHLTANAVEAMGTEAGVLRFELHPMPNEGIVLRITDTGPGIAHEDMNRVFEPFFSTKQGDDAMMPDHVGLGLAVVHGIVRDLGGHISFATGGSGGTICSLQFPTLRMPPGSGDGTADSFPA